MRDTTVLDIRQKRQVTYKWLMRLLWIGLALAVVAVIVFFFLLSRTNLPSLKELENPKSELASQIYGDNMEVLGRYYIENRVPVSYQQLSKNLVYALIATEDERYHKHSGIDIEALGRVVFKTVVLGKDAGGGSTITQQLAKLLFTGKPGSGFERALQKFKEWIIAIRLERNYTKEEIIAMYLNKFDFINDGDGIKAAAEIYFAKSQDSLDVEEAATLIGMLKNPWLYNPKRFPERSKERRDVVLFQMRKNGFLTGEQYEYHKAKPLDMSKFKRATQSEGIAPYYRAELSKDVRQLLEGQTTTDGRPYNIYRDGLKIYTTIDPQLQRIAEREMIKHMAVLQNNYFKHWKDRDPWKYKDSNTSAIEMDLRESALTKLVRESDRYQALRSQYLSAVEDELTTEIKGLNLRDVDIERILNESKKTGHITELLDKKFISNDMANTYRKILKSEHFSTLRSQWNKLQSAVRAQFKEPVNMTVFAYNDQMQKDTVMSPIDSIKYLRMFLQIGSLAVDPYSGEIKVWVGGVDHRWFKFDHIRSRRQVGSTFKPFVYATAISRQGFSPCFKVEDMPYTITPGESNFDLIKEWAPSNSDSKWTYQSLTLRDALRVSKNSVTVYLLKQIGSVEPVISMLDGMGIEKDAKYPNGQPIIPRVPSIVLGAADLMVWEMTGAYTTFANNGTYSEPYHIRKIEDKNGKVLYEKIPEQSLALKPEYNYVMLDMLRYNNSTAGGFNKIKTPTGGKTGTTNSFVDGWYMGVTPNLVVGTWVGGEERWIRFRSIEFGQGARMARPFFQLLLEAVEKDTKYGWDATAQFKRPTGDIGIEMDCGAYNRLNGLNTMDKLDDGFGDEL